MAPVAGKGSNAVVQALLQHVETPKASLRMLCGFVAMHVAIRARSGNLPAQPAQLQAMVDKLLHVLSLPACTVTASGMARVNALSAHTCGNFRSASFYI